MDTALRGKLSTRRFSNDNCNRNKYLCYMVAWWKDQTDCVEEATNNDDNADNDDDDSDDDSDNNNNGDDNGRDGEEA